MNPWRTLWLITLVLVASTLPASGDVRAAEPEENDAPEPGPAAPGEKDAPAEETSGPQQIVLQADVWASTAARGLAAGVPAVGAHALPPRDAASRTLPPAENNFVRIEAPIPGGQAQRCWFTCRDAHAPPRAG